jgi:xanthine dehydrogenase accessory factor
MKSAILAAVLAAQAARRPVALATKLDGTEEYLLPNDAAPPALNDAAFAALKRDRSGVADIDGAPWFFDVHNPSPRLFIIGAVHIAQALAPLAAAAGLDVTIIDPRRGFATEERFPGFAITHEWPDVALQNVKPDTRSAIVTLTHDPKLDDPALVEALKSEAFYVGALGSRKTHAQRRDRLTAAGFTEAALSRLHAPVGLDIGAITAPEIALSIVAEIVAHRRGGRLAQTPAT